MCSHKESCLWPPLRMNNGWDHWSNTAVHYVLKYGKYEGKYGKYEGAAPAIDACTESFGMSLQYERWKVLDNQQEG